MEIQIKEREQDDNTISFDLVIDSIIILEDTGLSNCCEHLMSNYGKLSKASFEGNITKLKKEVRNSSQA